MKSWLKSLPAKDVAKVTESNIKFEENKSKIVFENKGNKTCYKINVDGGAVTDNELRCDKMLVDEALAAFYYVELKGENIEHAIKQLEASLKRPALTPVCAKSKTSIAVGKNHFPKTSTLIQRNVKLFKKAYDAKLEVLSTPARKSI